MATLKLKPAGGDARTPASTRRAPVRGAGAQPRPTLAQAQAARIEREERYQEQLRQRYGEPRTEAPPDRRADPRAAPRAHPPGPPPRADRARSVANPAPARTAPPGAPNPNPRGPARATAPPSDRRPVEPAPVPARDERGASARPAPRGPRSADGRRGARGPIEPLESIEPMRDDAPAHPQGSLRLSKRMSELGIASRREADEWIAKGWVRVDDQVVNELGSRVLPHQRITVDAKAKYQQAQRVTVLVHKPVGYVSGQAEDGYEPAVVLVTPGNQWREDHSGTRFLREHLRSLVPAGRLDIDSVGLLVLTQDGRVAKQLIGEDSEIEKEYLVRVATADGQRLPEAQLARLRHGLELDGEALRPAQVEWVNSVQLRFVLTQGKKRQIRRMCEAVGLQVLGLKRVRIGHVMLGDLPAGQWRYLRMDERFD